ncbi:MAG: N-acetylneuraminate synthase family protein [Bdellovibrionota bacterium]
MNHYPLIEKVASTGKIPVIISLGLSTIKEIEDLHAFLISKNMGFVFLKCCSTYPADPRYINLATIPYLHKHLQINVGALTIHDGNWCCCCQQ